MPQDKMKNIIETTPYLKIAAWVANLGMGISFFLGISYFLHFDYSFDPDIIATPAFTLYPEQQDQWVYLLCLMLIPLVTLIGYTSWSILKKWFEKKELPHITTITFTMLLWWITPFSYLYTHQVNIQLILISLGISLIVAGEFLVSSLYHIPSFSTQLIIAAWGAFVGIAIIATPVEISVATQFPIRIMISTAFGLWTFWLGGTYVLKQTLNCDWQMIAESVAAGSTPLSLLPAQVLLWRVVQQNGQIVLRYIPLISKLFTILVALIATGFIFKSAHLALKGQRIPWDKISKKSFFWLALPLLLYVLTYNPNIYRPLDLFHEGERLSTAYAIIKGQTLYKDVVFVHGFLRDPGIALIAFQVLDYSVAALRIIESFLYPLVLVLTYFLALICFGDEWALLYSFLVLTGFWPFFLDWRMIPCLLTFIFLILFLYRASIYTLIAGGAFTFLSLVTSVDIGIVTLLAGSAFVILSSWTTQIKQRRAYLLGYFLTLWTLMLATLLYLANKGALLPALQWNWHLIAVNSAWNGMPFPLSANSDQLIKAILSPFSSILAIIYLLFSIVKKQWHERHWIICLLLIANITLYNRSLVGGQIYSTHLQAGNHFAPLLILTLLFPYKKNSTIIARIITISLIFALLTFTPFSSGSVPKLLNTLPNKNRVEIPNTWVLSGLPHVGPLFLPPEQETEISRIIDFLHQTDSFWDFTDHGSLYFLSDHLSPTRFYATHHIITREDQEQLIAQIEQNQPTSILFRSGTDWDAIAGVDRTLRSFLVSEYLLKEYHFKETIGGFTILEKGAPSSYPQPLAFRIDLGYVPFLWGQTSNFLDALHSEEVNQWIFADNPGDWELGQDVSSLPQQTERWQIITTGPDPSLSNLTVNLDPRSVTYLVLQMRVDNSLQRNLTAQLFWRSNHQPFVEERSVLFGVLADGEEHTYLLRLASFPSWTWSDQITGLRLDPADKAGSTINIQAIKLIQVDEINIK